MPSRRGYLIALVALSGCGRFGFDPAVDGGTAGGAVIWVLVHPTNAPDGPGIFVVDFETQQAMGRLTIPADQTSPHALAFDGGSLWLGGFGSVMLVELDPTSGAVRTAVGGIATEGVAASGGTLWYATAPPATVRLVEITHDGTEQRAIPVPFAVVNDLAFDGNSLYCVLNSTTDPIMRVAIPSGATSTVLEPAVTSGIVYALSYFEGELYVVDPRGANNVLRRIHPETGEVLGEQPLPVAGSITAIAFGRL